MRMARLVVTGQELKEICREVFTKAELLKTKLLKVWDLEERHLVK